MIDAYRAEYENRLSEQRATINELSKENARLNAEIESCLEKEKLISSTLIKAEKSAQDIIQQAEIQYSIELERLKKFAEKWEDYFTDLKNKYPMYPAVKKAIKIKDKAIASSKEKAKETIKEIDQMLGVDKKSKFNPKSKIKDYIAATEDNGFNLDEV